MKRLLFLIMIAIFLLPNCSKRYGYLSKVRVPKSRLEANVKRDKAGSKVESDADTWLEPLADTGISYTTSKPSAVGKPGAIQHKSWWHKKSIDVRRQKEISAYDRKNAENAPKEPLNYFVRWSIFFTILSYSGGFAVLNILLGFSALSSIRKFGGRGKVFAKIAIAFGFITLIIVGFFVIKYSLLSDY